MKRKYYRTSDFGLATILSYLYDMQGMELKDDKKSVLFIFDDSEELKKTIDLYWNRQLRVEPLQYLDTQKNLKARMYSFINEK